LVLAPGLIDMRVFAGEGRESLETTSNAAAAGGVTTIVVMPNTDPVVDEPSLVDFIYRRAASAARVHVAQTAALTRKLAGETMTEIGLLMEAGAVAFTDGDKTVANAKVFLRALAYSSNFDALVIGHAEDPDLIADAAMNQSELAMRYGIPSAPSAAETIVVERDLRLVELTGARYHFGQISCRAALEAIVAAKARGLPVTCGVSAHHLALNDNDVGAYRTAMKVKPPLRAEADRAAMAEGVADGSIDVVVSSHDPQSADSKRQPFALASFGAVGLETLLPAALSVHHNGAGLMQVIKALTLAPARILGLRSGRLAKGAPADLVLFDPDAPFVLDAKDLHSRARNTPFDGRKFQGRVKMTFVDGKMVFPWA
jgi:dihydroorotase